MRLSLTVMTPDATTDVLVDAQRGSTVAHLRAAILPAVGEAGESVPINGSLWLGQRELRPELTLEGAGLRSGSVLGLHPVAPSAPAEAGWQLLVVAGPAAGTVLPLSVGEHVLGREGALAVADPAVSRRHLCLRVTEVAVEVEDLGSSNGTSVDGSRLLRPVRLRPGDLLSAGDSVLEVAQAHAGDAAVQPGDGGVLDYNRPPRLLPDRTPVQVVLPIEPQPEHRRTLSLIAVAAPALMGVTMAVVLRNPLYLMFAFMSPVIALANFAADRRSGRASQRQKQTQYEQDLAGAQEKVEHARLLERSARREDHPDPARTLLTALLPDRRLWERRRRDDDALVLRVGVATVQADVHVTRRGAVQEDPPEQPVVEDVPVTVPLREVGVLGVAAPKATARSIVRWLVLQAAVRHSPRDLQVVLLSDRSSGPDWQWLQWLPHARTSDVSGPLALVGVDGETVTARVNELTALVRARAEEVRAAGRADAAAFQTVVVVLDGARALRALPGIAQLLQEGPALGVLAVCLDDRERLLPEECQAVVALDPVEPAYLTVTRTRGSSTPHVLADQITAAVAERAARALAPLRDASADDEDAQLPGSARLLDVLELEPPTAGAVVERWRRGGRSTTAVVGEGIDGPFALDLRRDGPHGLVAGTTGSGKSELLQTIVASLAVANRPDAMTFVLVDYKGGSAFKDCVDLPHTVGMVTDLDTVLVERALTSLKAELTRREHILAGTGAKDIEDYTELQERDGLAPLPRLLIVIDEFASMARELPEFVSGLVNIAQRGRSLGIHLLLATQRPSGVVSPEIRANTNLRIALRVTDSTDSTDVLNSTEAARIAQSTPGRAYARLGPANLVAFQSGRVGGRRPGAVEEALRPPFVVQTGWATLGYGAPQAPLPATAATQAEVTDLAVLVRAVREAAEQVAVPPQHSPWLEALPAVVTLADLPPSPAPVGDLAPVPYGVEDLPAEQAQRAAVLDLARDGHLFAVGAPRTGRSGLLRTLAVSAARLHSTEDVHLYGLDCGNGALLPLTDLPHTGAVVLRSQPERATRLITRLVGELERRQAVLAEGGYADITEQRQDAASGAALPHVLLLLDRWEGFVGSLGEADGGRLFDAVLSLLREGASLGIHLVVTGDRSLLSGRVAPLTEDKIAFRLADRADVSLLGINPRSLPEDIAPGRGYRSESGIELQVALLDGDATGVGQAAAVAAAAAGATARDADVPRSRRPFRVDVLPAAVSFDAAWELVEGDPKPLWALVAVGGDELSALGTDLGSGVPAFVVAGASGAGRSTALVSLARSVLRTGGSIAVVAPRPSPLRTLAGSEGVLAVHTEALLPSTVVEEWLVRAGDRPFALVLDDAELLKDCGAADVLKELVKGVRGSGRAVVLGGSADDLCSGFTGWQVEAKKARRGLLLSPQGVNDGDLIGVRVPRSAIGGSPQPGRGLLHLGNGQLHTVQVPS